MSSMTADSVNNASQNHSGISMDTSFVLSGLHAEINHLWSQILSNTTGYPEGGMQNNRSNFLKPLSSENIAYDYLKKLENCWELPNHTPLLNNYNVDSMVEFEPNPPPNISDIVNYQSYFPYDLEHHNRSFTSTDDNRYQISLNNSLFSSDTSDSYSLSKYFIESTMEPEKHKPTIKKQGYGNCALPTMEGGRASGSSDGKKKRSGNSLGTGLSKKSKIGNSSTSSIKAPTARITEQISALHPLVSPFGKTDSASVLLETLNCIEYLHEQVQLLSDPYKNTRPTQDLRSRGLCLFPVSCTPKTYTENTGPDYWPTHRACSYK